jgi:hypothetical protein
VVLEEQVHKEVNAYVKLDQVRTITHVEHRWSGFPMWACKKEIIMEKVVCMRCHNVIQIHKGVVSGANNIPQNILHIQTECVENFVECYQSHITLLRI